MVKKSILKQGLKFVSKYASLPNKKRYPIGYLFLLHESKDVGDSNSNASNRRLEKQSGGLFFRWLVCRRVLKSKAFRSPSSQDAEGGCISDGSPRQSKRQIVYSDFFCKKSERTRVATLPFPKKVTASRSARLQAHSLSLDCLPTFFGWFAFGENRVSFFYCLNQKTWEIRTRTSVELVDKNK